MSVSTNPSGCCGVHTQCCPDFSIPDRLTASISTDCGDFTISLANITSAAPPAYPTWQGSGSLSCRLPGSPCLSHDVAVILQCYGLNAFYVLIHEQGNDGTGNVSSINCGPLVVVADFFVAGMCTQSFQIIITE